MNSNIVNNLLKAVYNNYVSISKIIRDQQKEKTQLSTSLDWPQLNRGECIEYIWSTKLVLIKLV